jgi:Tfp pilus assembly protein PilX
MGSRAHQRGVTLLVGMIMLVLVTVLVLASFHLGRNNLEIVGNAQQRAEGLATAQQTIEAAFTSPLLTSSPEAIFPKPCPGFGNNTLCYDVNGDSKNDVVVQITPPPKCIKAQPIPTTSLNLANTNDQQCTLGISQGAFGTGAANNNSNCANTVWDIRAVAQGLDAGGDAPVSQGATAVVDQGVAVRVATNEVETSCP